ncbi:tryptophan transporter [Bacillus timonensis]|nr:tryptophan transporter [Bacillus timonensis]
MNTRVLVLLSLLVGMGAVLHAVMPPLLLGMKPDLMLAMMFLGIMFFPTRKNALLVGGIAGLISALTTTFPAGQLPNMIDKPITALLFLGLFVLVNKFNQSVLAAGILTAIGTMVSGTVFLGSALLIAGLPGASTFLGLFVAVVLPTALLNTIAMVVIYPIAQQILKRTKLVTQVS